METLDRDYLDRAERERLASAAGVGPKALALLPACHPEGGVEAYYRRGNLELWCHVCHAAFVRLAVADRVPSDGEKTDERSTR